MTPTLTPALKPAMTPALTPALGADACDDACVWCPCPHTGLIPTGLAHAGCYAFQPPPRYVFKPPLG